MKREMWIVAMLLVLGLSGCQNRAQSINEEETQTTYRQIGADEAKKMMDGQPEAIVLDVREPEEYEEGHIPGAMLLPLGTVGKVSASAMIPAKDSACWCTAAADGAAKSPRRSWRRWGMKRYTNSAGSSIGRMRWKTDNW